MAGLQVFELFGTVDLKGGQKMMGEILNIGQAAQGGLKPALFATGTAVAALATAVGVFAMKSSMDIGKSTRIIKQETGATGDSLKSLQDSFKNVWAQVPEGADVVTRTMDMIYQRTSAGAKDLQTLTKQYLDLARMQGGEASATADAGTAAFNNWKIATKDQGKELDTLFRISQATGVPVSDLLGSVKQFGPLLRQTGFSFDQSAAMVASFTKAGISGDKALGGLRFSLKLFAQDAQKGYIIQKPLSEIDKEMNKIGKVGAKDAAAGVKLLFDTIKNARTPAEATALAVKFFGKSGLDMGDAIRNGRVNVADFLKTVEGGKSTISGTADETKTFSEKMGQFGHEAEIAIQPLGDVILKLRGSLFPALTDGVKLIGDFGKWFGSLPQPVQTAGVEIAGLGIIMVALAKPIGSVIGMIGKYVTAVQGAATATAAGEAVSAGGAAAALSMSAAIGVGIGVLINQIPAVQDAQKALGDYLANLKSVAQYQDDANTAVGASPAVLETMSKMYDQNTGALTPYGLALQDASKKLAGTASGSRDAARAQLEYKAALEAVAGYLSGNQSAELVALQDRQAVEAAKKARDATKKGTAERAAADLMLTAAQNKADESSKGLTARFGSMTSAEIKTIMQTGVLSKSQMAAAKAALAHGTAIDRAKASNKLFADAMSGKLTPALVFAAVKAGKLTSEQGNTALAAQNASFMIDGVGKSLKKVPLVTHVVLDVGVNDTPLQKMVSLLKSSHITLGSGAINFEVRAANAHAAGGYTTSGPEVAVIGDNPSGRESVISWDTNREANVNEWARAGRAIGALQEKAASKVVQITNHFTIPATIKSDIDIRELAKKLAAQQTIELRAAGVFA